MPISANDLRAGVLFEQKGNIYRVEKFKHQMYGRGKAIIRVNARNLKSGKLKEFRFTGGFQVEEAEVKRRPLEFLYYDVRKDQLLFLDKKSKEKLGVESRLLGGTERQFLKSGEEVRAYFHTHSDDILSLEIPLSVVLKVTEAGASEKGDSTGSVTKPVILETGAVIQAPMFIKNGDLVRVKTETGEYVERVQS